MVDLYHFSIDFEAQIVQYRPILTVTVIGVDVIGSIPLTLNTRAQIFQFFV